MSACQCIYEASTSETICDQKNISCPFLMGKNEMNNRLANPSRARRVKNKIKKIAKIESAFFSDN
jgi:hypothetical protein